MKTINTSLYDFATLRDPEANYIYVDKTAQLHEIAKPGSDLIYYLPRPRRFGKSLMISTLKYLFQGRRDLFEGLAIDSMDWNWEKEIYPVLHLDMAHVASKTAEELEISLGNLIEAKCGEFALSYEPAKSAKDNFFNLLGALPQIAPKAAKTAARITEDPTGAAVKRLLVSAYSKLSHDWVCMDEKEVKRYFIAFMIFAAESRSVTYIGVNYDPAERTVSDIVCEPVD